MEWNMASNQAPKKHINIKKWGPKIGPPPRPPRNSSCTVFCWENQHLHKEFGRLSPLLDPPARVPPKFFMQIFFGCFFPFVINAAQNRACDPACLRHTNRFYWGLGDGLHWPRGSKGVQRYGCIPRSAANNLGESPKNLGAPNLSL